ncbi:ABC transporter permease [Allopusillimonas ginsengisoli]|uniref:ABC transporter permease n=1 Tax=Allopusillimonas ginsengisoli TaxID=453575 RepID=UPI00101F8C54|nr:ABC transporter permease [Allopusillimonas ginsengisoli]TEA78760.1 ABC transporter permease [Allopusillimonas ginsengisoli]
MTMLELKTEDSNVQDTFSVNSSASAMTSRAQQTFPRDHTRTIAVVLAIAMGLSILFFWKLAVHQQWVSTIVLPAPESVAIALYQGLIGGEVTWWIDIWVTLKETMIGFVCGITVALTLGALFAYVPVLRMAAFPYVVFLQTFPKIAIAPVLVAWLGYGLLPKIVIGALLAFFPVFANTVAGLSQINADELRLLRSFGASRWQELRYLRLPSALPYIFAAMDVAVVVSLLGVIVGEFVGAEQGLGYRIQARTGFGDMASVYAVLFILGCIGTSLYQLMRFLRSLLLFEE